VSSNETTPTHYELLGVSRKASGVEVASAYRAAKQAWDPQSLAVYSLYSHNELSAINHQLDEAYRTLSDPFLRARYDAALAGQEPTGPAAMGTPTLSEVSPGEEQMAQEEAPHELDPALLEEIEQTDCFDGPLLARIRQAKGISIEEIADRTKIGRNHLREIEAEQFSRPIAAVYLKGYLKQYALVIGLDPDRVLSTYPSLQNHGNWVG